MGQRAVQEGKVSKGKAGPTVLDKAGPSSSSSPRLPLVPLVCEAVEQTVESVYS